MVATDQLQFKHNTHNNYTYVPEATHVTRVFLSCIHSDTL